MKELDKVSFETSQLLGVQAKLLGNIEVPEAMPDLMEFVTKFRGAVHSGIKTMISGKEEFVKVVTITRNNNYLDEYHIDVPKGQLASIRYQLGSWSRLLTENEGRGLVTDIGQLLLRIQ